MARVFEVATGSGGGDGCIVIDYRECADDNGDNDDDDEEEEEVGGNWDNDWGRVTKTATRTMPLLTTSAFGVQRFLDPAAGVRLPRLGTTGQKRGEGGGDNGGTMTHAVRGWSCGGMGR